MRMRGLVGILAAAMFALLWPFTSGHAGPNSFRYVDASDRLPADINPPDTDTLDVDFADVVAMAIWTFSSPTVRHHSIPV
jgi:hypothetical protein